MRSVISRVVTWGQADMTKIIGKLLQSLFASAPKPSAYCFLFVLNQWGLKVGSDERCPLAVPLAWPWNLSFRRSDCSECSTYQLNRGGGQYCHQWRRLRGSPWKHSLCQGCSAIKPHWKWDNNNGAEQESSLFRLFPLWVTPFYGNAYIPKCVAISVIVIIWWWCRYRRYIASMVG